MTNLYLIKALTNMHVGSGEISYDLIDNKVQRDVTTGFPIINSSSLKGALRNYFESRKYSKLLEVFGDKDGTVGEYKFFSANLLSIPVRSNKKPFFRATCPQIIKDLINLVEEFNIKFSLKDKLITLEGLIDKEEEPIIFEKIKDVIIEDCFAKFKSFENKEELYKLFGENMVLFSDNTFKLLIQELPVVARNKLVNGESKNLWYEEVIPRESRFYFTILNGSKRFDNNFNHALSDGPVQIGANASIGYGYTIIEKLVGEENE